jgi:phosphoglucomutase
MTPQLTRELSALENRLIENSGDKQAKEQIYERFYKDLDFGTGGLRGILGAGTNRMNIFTVRRVTQGFANYIKLHYGENEKVLSVAIAYDSRNNSTRFAIEAAGVLAANGILVHIFPKLMPTPALSFAVRHFGCSGGIVITASHNPANYNGYKVYDHQGCQVTDKAAYEILRSIEKVDMFNDVKTLDKELGRLSENCFWEEEHPELIKVIPDEVTEAYIAAVKATRIGVDSKDLEVVYTPLNGAGNLPVRRILDEIGITKIHIVPEQENPDGNFPTCSYPNPEKEEALLKGLELCYKLGSPDLLLATDPDSDRLGIAVRHVEDNDKVAFKKLSGNQVGVLLLDFLCANRRLPKNPITMKTIVSTKMADAVASAHGIEMINLLTGFKYIGEQIGYLEMKGEEDRFIFGFEESYGYLGGPYVRDKDAVNAAMLICEAAAYYKSQGKTLVDRIEELYNIYGWYKDELLDFAFEGAAGMDKMAEIMSKLRQNPPKEIIGLQITTHTDYNDEKCQTNLPKSNVLEYILEDGSSVIIRPSGTEPKLKVYLSAKGIDKENSIEIIDKLKDKIGEWINK